MVASVINYTALHFSIKDFFHKCNQIRSFLRGNFIFCAVLSKTLCLHGKNGHVYITFFHFKLRKKLLQILGRSKLEIGFYKLAQL